jgi:integrase
MAMRFDDSFCSTARGIHSDMALVFLYSEVLEMRLDWLNGTAWLMASLMYGSGLRLLECVELRVKDLDLDQREIRVRDGKGRKDRVTTLPSALADPPKGHLARVRALHERDPADGCGWLRPVPGW